MMMFSASSNVEQNKMSRYRRVTRRNDWGGGGAGRGAGRDEVPGLFPKLEKSALILGKIVLLVVSYG